MFYFQILFVFSWKLAKNLPSLGWETKIKIAAALVVWKWGFWAPGLAKSFWWINVVLWHLPAFNQMIVIQIFTLLWLYVLCHRNDILWMSGPDRDIVSLSLYSGDWQQKKDNWCQFFSLVENILEIDIRNCWRIRGRNKKVWNSIFFIEHDSNTIKGPSPITYLI